MISLPDSSFVDFSAYRATNAHIVWNNSMGLRQARLNEHAYFVPLPGDDASCVDSGDAKVFRGERYGGGGIGVNGGGARCGLHGAIQIKGIGPNVLAGREGPYWHSYGGESLAGSIREAIWGEICNAVLPHGAVRVHGVVDTGTSVPRHGAMSSQLPVSTRRGLTIREAALRPAHYIRALEYRRDDEKFHGIGSDAGRTRLAVGSLPATCRSLYQITSGSDVEAINTGLLCMATRFAQQHAASWAKRMIHGTISASNLSLDGRAIDFGTMSSVSDYGRIIVAKAGFDAWQTSPISDVLRELLRTLIKYVPFPDKLRLLAYAELLNTFTEACDTSKKKEFVKLIGFPQSFVEEAGVASFDRLYDCMVEIISAGNLEPFRLYSACAVAGADMPHQMGEYRLNDILTTVALHAGRDEADHALRPQLADEALRKRFIQEYFAIREVYLARFSEQGRGAAMFLLALDSVRLNQDLPGLYRHHLDRRIEAAVNDGIDLQSFSDAIVLNAVAMLGNRAVDDAAPTRTGKDRFSLSVQVGKDENGVRQNRPLQIDLDRLILSSEQKNILRDLCGKAF
ncbi:hypothetical protein INH39_17685 [Massilia violaceinigra]|uniref:MchC protein n=1 Tax=Massilia violaceinigra TaxID=2045208 RepID=A0ABY3ZY23_9BURK|nr:hypothetical protein [Massilia violaceinigra]UOD27366.1 hypothetical protein INH39_17685 [Massilia violaceinigra]